LEVVEPITKTPTKLNKELIGPFKESNKDLSYNVRLCDASYNTKL
jgi:hypothetical protein